MKIERSKEWWMESAKREGDATPAAGVPKRQMPAPRQINASRDEVAAVRAGCDAISTVAMPCNYPTCACEPLPQSILTALRHASAAQRGKTWDPTP